MHEQIGLLRKQPLELHDYYYEVQFALIAGDKELADQFLTDICEQLDITPRTYPGVFRLSQSLWRDAVLGICKKVLAIDAIY